MTKSFTIYLDMNTIGIQVKDILMKLLGLIVMVIVMVILYFNLVMSFIYI